jgi:hypothetical protein
LGWLSIEGVFQPSARARASEVDVVVERSRVRDRGGAVANQALDDGAHPSQGRASIWIVRGDHPLARVAYQSRFQDTFASCGYRIILRLCISMTPLRWSSLISLETASRVEEIILARS